MIKSTCIIIAVKMVMGIFLCMIISMRDVKKIIIIFNIIDTQHCVIRLCEKLHTVHRLNALYRAFNSKPIGASYELGTSLSSLYFNVSGDSDHTDSTNGDRDIIDGHLNQQLQQDSGYRCRLIPNCHNLIYIYIYIYI